METNRIDLTHKQQGDVLFTRISTLPVGNAKAKPSDERGIVLAEGEVTGHYHGIADTEGAELIAIGDRMLLRLDKLATVTHQEHKSITLEPGIWEIGVVREWDYLAEMERKVVD